MFEDTWPAGAMSRPQSRGSPATGLRRRRDARADFIVVSVGGDAGRSWGPLESSRPSPCPSRDRTSDIVVPRRTRTAGRHRRPATPTRSRSGPPIQSLAVSGEQRLFQVGLTLSVNSTISSTAVARDRVLVTLVVRHQTSTASANRASSYGSLRSVSGLGPGGHGVPVPRVDLPAGLKLVHRQPPGGYGWRSPSRHLRRRRRLRPSLPSPSPAPSPSP